MHHTPNFGCNTRGSLQHLVVRLPEIARTWDSQNVSTMPYVGPRELAKQGEGMLLCPTKSFAELCQHAEVIISVENDKKTT